MVLYLVYDAGRGRLSAHGGNSAAMQDMNQFPQAHPAQTLVNRSHDLAINSGRSCQVLQSRSP